ncbi:FAR1 domain-containing protein [Cephalotus follicularis]|uniref:FAR1 domain-containing protein n=1 Tax=Cephalotus follicularis TaxID=3775 RepID=A0A1Q3CND4_CEPFO|nr:FAR1 domain-containing protein [Cephalotus follicularis]
MEFSSEEASYEFYKSYSKKLGFDIRKAYRHVYKNSNEVLDRTFYCARASKNGKDKREVNVKCPRAQFRCGCPAKMVVSAHHSGNFRVMKFVVEHNQVLSTTRKIHLLRSHRKITHAQAARGVQVISSGVVQGHEATMELLNEFGTVSEYMITPYRTHHVNVITYDSSNDSVVCSCRKFTFAGILCSNVLKVFTIKDVLKIPDVYILKRWKTNAKVGCAPVIRIDEVRDPKEAVAVKYQDLCGLSQQVITWAS